MAFCLIFDVLKLEGELLELSQLIQSFEFSFSFKESELESGKTVKQISAENKVSVSIQAMFQQA